MLELDKYPRTGGTVASGPVALDRAGAEAGTALPSAGTAAGAALPVQHAAAAATEKTGAAPQKPCRRG